MKRCSSLQRTCPFRKKITACGSRLVEHLESDKEREEFFKNLPYTEKCPFCKNSLTVAEMLDNKCWACGERIMAVCSNCLGTGNMSTCPICEGKGKVVRKP
jgi:predicted RNA-binding Zn-ribbon protein involved in translation (DUF1610 family)